ncbi:FAD dependent oxidoreductase [Radiomyces spectabilis]|uniref:FAD dependent oxidoreductase n=1 Tax=Radiomyces spectabilis TaxID=64574 RepID=UPI00221F3FCD|nr:FAD dependent oxidoreductase [Radiomyces spectabilis]KAI8372907.1 FAD dependent oxidoreductase [Radiomyces spectabilis]
MLARNAVLASRRCFATSKTPDLEIDNLVVGAGVVGLAIGEKLTATRPSETTIVIDKNKRIGEETSSRNSEVIHAGIYYPKDSLKTALCIRGKGMLYQLLSEKSMPYRKVGKWVVAQSEEQHAYLETMHQKAANLGVETYFLSKDQAAKEEPNIRAQSVLVSPSTGIIDSHAFMDYLQQRITENGGDVGLHTMIRSICPSEGGGYLVELATPPHTDSPTTVLCRRIFNSGGLHADKVSNLLMPNRYKLNYARGHYYAYSSPCDIRHLIYPCPEKHLAGLGTHLTLDMAGRIKFGPDVQWVDDPYDYTVPDDADKKQQFVEAISTFLPSIRRDKLQPDYAGIR